MRISGLGGSRIIVLGLVTVRFIQQNPKTYPEGSAQPHHRARVPWFDFRKCVPTCFIVEWVVIRCSCSLCLGHLVWMLFGICFVFFASRLPKLIPNFFKIMKTRSWESLGSSMGSPWRPKCIQVNENTLIKLDFLPSSPGTIFGTFKEFGGRLICFFLIFSGRHVDGVSLISAYFRVCFLGTRFDCV